MVAKFLFVILIFLFGMGCSVYKSQGRKSFENDTPVRVPISLTFHCRNSNSLNEPSQTTSLEQLRQIPGVVIQQTISQETVILLARSLQTEQVCISDGLDLETYNEIHDTFASQLNTWP